jgi:adenine-specific DNA-methyltransferase
VAQAQMNSHIAPESQSGDGFEYAWAAAQALVKTFLDNKRHYVDSGSYQEMEARTDFIDKFFIALGWDVNHDRQRDPYRQEVKIEKSAAQKRSSGRPDYVFSLAPFFRRTRFLVEAKRPQQSILSPDNCFQTIRYGWPQGVPICVLTDFNNIHILDTRFRPNINSAVSRVIKSWHCSEFADRDKFSAIYWLLSREAVAQDSIDRFADEFLPEQQAAARQYNLFPGETRDFDDDFLIKLDEWREQLAVVFKAADIGLSSEHLTETVQRTLDRLIFIRFLEDKAIEEMPIILCFGQGNKTHWQDFVVASKRLDQIYNGTVFKIHPVLDDTKFQPESVAFADICDELTDEHSPYNFDSIPVEILGRIYERFLGKVVLAKKNKISIVEKDDVRKAGGVYYTPDYIVAYMVENSLGKLARGRKPNDILALRIIDTACGSGSFLIGAFGYLMQVLLALYRANPSRATKYQVEERDGELHLTMRHKREILLKCIYGVDIDRQAVEVAQLSLYLKLMETETTFSARHQQIEMGAALLPSLTANIVEGNSLVTLDEHGDLFSVERLKELKSLNFKTTFAEVFGQGGFDLVIGNPPYIKEYVNRDAFAHVRTSLYYQGKMDIWYLFACRGMDWLKPDTGIFAFIATNNWVTNFGAKKLREKITQEMHIEQLIDFGDYKVFRDAGIQTMILILRKSSQPDSYSFDYRRLSGQKLTQRNAQALLQNEPGAAYEYLTPTFNRGRQPQAPLTFSNSSAEHLLDKIESCRNFQLDGNKEMAQGIVPNIDVVSARSIDLIPVHRRRTENIQVGDGVFVVNAGKFPSPTIEEREFLKPLYEPTDIDRYTLVRNANRRIIYSSKAIIGREKLPERFMEHLKKYREIMRERRENQTGQIDYYHLHWPRDPKFFDSGPKILCVRKCEVPTFAYTEKEAYVMMAFNIIRTDRVNLLFLTGLLNSRLVKFWLKHRGKMQGNNFQLDKEPLLAIPICVPAITEQERIAKLVERVIECRSQLSKARSSADQEQLSRLMTQWDNEIQSSIESLYGLSDEEQNALTIVNVKTVRDHDEEVKLI